MREQAASESPNALRQRPPIRQFTIARTLEDIPPPEPCPLCAAPTCKATIPYRCYGKVAVVKNETAPGYQCTRCGAGLFDPYTTLELVSTAASLLQGTEELVRRAALHEEAAALCRELAGKQGIPATPNL